MVYTSHFSFPFFFLSFFVIAITKHVHENGVLFFYFYRLKNKLCVKVSTLKNVFANKGKHRCYNKIFRCASRDVRKISLLQSKIWKINRWLCHLLSIGAVLNSWSQEQLIRSYWHTRYKRETMESNYNIKFSWKEMPSIDFSFAICVCVLYCVLCHHRKPVLLSTSVVTQLSYSNVKNIPQAVGN